METLFVKDKLYVPISLVKYNSVKEAFTHVVYDEPQCSRCPYLQERHCIECDACPFYIGTIETFSKKEYREKQYIGLPLGQKENFLDLLNIDNWKQVNIVDLRNVTKFDYNITFGGIEDGKLRDYQNEIVSEFLNYKCGIIVAPPRSGKTIMALDIGIKLGMRMLVIANQNEFLDQFIDHVARFSNLPLLEKKYNKKLFGVAKKESDFETFQIAASTYQRFLSDDGQQLLKRIAKNYGTLWIDEIHRANANAFSKVVSKIPARVKFGSTGTPDRKDGREMIMRDIIGNVVVESNVESMIPLVSVVWTGFTPKHKYKNWTYANRWICSNEERNVMIIERILTEVDNGHSIIVPCIFRDHIAELTRRINSEYGRRIADYFVGGGDKKNLARRELVLDEAKSGKLKVVVGTRSILQLGLNVPRWSMIIEVCPISNKPNLKQETSRIRTPMEGKKTPEVIFFVDNLNQSTYCFKSSLHHVQQFGYRINPQSYGDITQALKNIGAKNWLLKEGEKDVKPKKSKTPKKLFGTGGKL